MMNNKTPWAVICNHHGLVYLTREQYGQQLDEKEELWKCPICNLVAEWDDETYEEWLNSVEMK